MDGVVTPQPDDLIKQQVKEKVATRKGLEPSTSGVTGRRSNQLNYRAMMAGAEGLEPSARGFGDRCSTN